MITGKRRGSFSGRLATALLSVFALTSCGGWEGFGRSPEEVAGLKLVREMFTDRVPTIDAALPLASKVDTMMGTPTDGLRFAGWFAAGRPVRLDVERFTAGEVASFTHYYYDEGALIASSSEDAKNGPSGRFVGRVVYGREREALWGEITKDGRPIGASRAWTRIAEDEKNYEPKVREVLTRIAKRSP